MDSSRTTVLLVDDEKLARDRLKSFLSQAGHPGKVLEAENGIAALEILGEEEVDLLFLDVQMPGLNGFETLAQLEARPFQLIFQTAFDQHAIRAFEENACDYLLKPFPLERFRVAYERALDRLKAGKLVDSSAAETSELKRQGWLQSLLVKSGTRSLVMPTERISAFLSRDHYTVFEIEGKEYVTDLSLSHLESRLDPERFLRLHRNNIVAREAIRALRGGDNMEVELLDGTRLPVSRNNRKKLKEWFPV
jgi:two-component system, LytTR family, response regulator